MVSEEDTLTGKALKKAREHGVVTAIVAGNDRNNTWGYNYHNLKENIDTSAMGSPANLPGSFTVGSIDNNFMYSQLLKFTGKEFLIATPYDEAYAENAEVYYPEWAGTEENNRFLALGDFAKVDPKEVEGKIVAAYRGAGTFVDKYDNALRMGGSWFNCWRK